MTPKTRSNAAPARDPAEPEALGAPTPEDLELESPHETRAPAPDPGAAAGEDTEAARLYKDRWLRAEADLQNFRRRAQRDREEAERFAIEQSLLETIAQLDDLERALDAARTAGAPESWTEGVRLVGQRMRDVLGKHGVAEIEAEGRRFDPEVHEALLEIDAPPGVAPGQIVQVVRRGYRRGERALRAARVIVARAPELA